MMPTVVRIGRQIGKMICQSVWEKELPSMAAASSSDVGIDLTNPSTRKMPIGRPKEIYGRSRVYHLFEMPHCLKTT